jgi:hypothetical protein
VGQSEGLFVYAATAVRHIGGKGAPENRLEDVLKLHKGLDNLYIQVIEDASDWDYFSIVMGSLLYLRYPLGVRDLSRILHPLYRPLTTAGIRYALGSMLELFEHFKLFLELLDKLCNMHQYRAIRFHDIYLVF